MNDSTFSSAFSSESSAGKDHDSDQSSPQFGAIDIVEAFTAMRHEFRGQTKESRALAEQIQVAAANLKLLESSVIASANGSASADAKVAKDLVLLIVETDHQLSRAVTAITQFEEARQKRELADAKSLDHFVAGMSQLARWFARPLLAFLAEQRASTTTDSKHPGIEGLNMILSRLRRMMHEQNIDRLDILGKPFDAEMMNAIGSVASTEFASGEVAEQLSAAYYWQDKLVRYAEVRIAK